jgi:hypothetical protein
MIHLHASSYFTGISSRFSAREKSSLHRLPRSPLGCLLDLSSPSWCEYVIEQGIRRMQGWYDEMHGAR